MKRTCLFFLFILVCSAVSAQDNKFKRTNEKSQRFWTLGIGSSSQTMYDEAISYVRYQNSGLAFSFSLLKRNEKRYREFSLEPTFVKLETKLSNELRPMEVTTTRIASNYQVLKRLRSINEKTELYVGGVGSLLFNSKVAPQLDNSQLVYDYALSIGATARLDREFYWKKRNCKFSYTLAVPLLAHIARPYYLNRIEFIDPKNDFIGDFLNNSTLTSVNKYFRVTSGAAITYPLFNRNTLRLGYRWDFYTMRTINKVYAAEHLVSLTFMSNY